MWTSATGFVFETISGLTLPRGYSPNPAVTFSHLDGIFIESQEPRPIESFRPFEHRFRALVNLLGDCQLEISSLKCRQEIDQPPEVEVFGDGSRVPFGTRRAIQFAAELQRSLGEMEYTLRAFGT